MLGTRKISTRNPATILNLPVKYSMRRNGAPLKLKLEGIALGSFDCEEKNAYRPAKPVLVLKFSLTSML